jgi:hypothetical protein
VTATVKAADLPAGSVVATDREAWVKTYLRTDAPWVGSSDKSDDQIDALLAAGAAVLREGRLAAPRDAIGDEEFAAFNEVLRSAREG